MKFLPAANKTPDDENVYGQWIAVFNALLKDSSHVEAVKLLDQYNSFWPTVTKFEPVSTNEFGIPEIGMLKALGYSVAFKKSQTHSNTAEYRLSLLLHIFENELPPLSSLEYRNKWGAPSSVERINRLISVLENLTRGKEARYKRNQKPVQRWKEDIEGLKTFRSRKFNSLT